MAQKGGRVLLIDADMRRPGIAKALKLSLTKGLSGILTGAYEYGPELLFKMERVGSLSILPSGPIPPNPAELLCSMKMEALLKRLRQDFDHIIHRLAPGIADHGPHDPFQHRGWRHHGGGMRNDHPRRPQPRLPGD